MSEPAENPVDAPVDSFAENPAEGPAADSQEVNVPDSILVSKDTVYWYDTIVVYKDTVYDTLYDTLTYKSFVYRKNSGALDTVYGGRAINCDIDEDGRMTCRENNLFVDYIRCCDTYAIDTTHIRFFVLDTNRVYVHIQDTVYVDTLRLNKTVFVDDTTRYNYGENRLTDYIPPEYIYVAEYAPFDSVQVRNLLDTLDFGESADERAITVQSNLEFVGLPAVVYELMPLDTVRMEVLKTRDTMWPEEKEARTRRYYFDPSDELTSDTTVTWTLSYTHYEKGVEEADSVQVITYIKLK